MLPKVHAPSHFRPRRRPQAQLDHSGAARHPGSRQIRCLDRGDTLGPALDEAEERGEQIGAELNLQIVH